VIGTGLALLALGPRNGFVVGLHKDAFVVWLVVTGIHVLAYLPRLPRLVAGDWRGGNAVGGSLARKALLAGALVVGAILALVTIRYAQPWAHWQEGSD